MTKTGRISNIDIHSQAIKSPFLCTSYFARESATQLASRKICSKCSKGNRFARLTTELCIFLSFHGWFSEEEAQKIIFLELNSKTIPTQSIKHQAFLREQTKPFQWLKIQPHLSQEYLPNRKRYIRNYHYSHVKLN